MKSMTAFARSSKQHDGMTITWEVKSVNHRYLESYVRLPDAFRSFEIPVKETCKRTLDRGKLDLTLTIQRDESDASLVLNQGLVDQLRRLVSELDPAAKLDPLRILSWPGALQHAQLDSEMLEPIVLETLNEALSKLIDNRSREGAAIFSLIQERCDAIREQVSKASELMPILLDAQRTRLLSKFEELSVQVDPDRLEAELVLLAQKADIDEEIDRLNAHVDEVERVIRGDKSMGRRLDFLMQELNREANTLSSKSLGTELTNVAVELKVLIEQMREQIQNVE